MARTANASPYLTLDRYRQLMNIPLCAFNGVENPNETLLGCDNIWTQWEREMIAQALADAEGMLAEHLRYWLGVRFLQDQGHSYTNPIVLDYGHIVGAGIEAQTAVTPSASDFTVDPATITVAQSDFSGGTSEIQIIETSSGLEIYPDKVTSVGANYVIEIDQCKLVEWDDLETQIDPIDYDAAFPAATWLKLADLTIYRHYLDTSDQATVEFGPNCQLVLCGSACAGTSQDGCVYVIDPTISKVRVQLADYSSGTGTWTFASPLITQCHPDDKVTVNYQAGHLPPNWEQAVRRLAHTYMDVTPCGCNLFKMIVNRDQKEPSVLTAERINCPLGMMDGAWFAWTWIGNNQHVRAFMLG